MDRSQAHLIGSCQRARPKRWAPKVRRNSCTRQQRLWLIQHVAALPIEAAKNGSDGNRLSIREVQKGNG